MKIAVLGSGPAGLLIVHAAVLHGIKDITILTYGDKSALYGAQYLHEPIPGIQARHTVINHRLKGTIDGYKQKVYGYNYRGTVSPEEYAGGILAFDIRQAYNELWWHYEDLIVRTATKLAGKDVRELPEHYDLVFSTVPRKDLCLRDTHLFESAKIYAMGDSPNQSVHVPVDRDTFIMSGDPADAWYRVADVFGHRTVEYPAKQGDKKPPLDGIVTVNKPVDTNCDCHPNIIRMGRFGQWRKGVLTHHAFKESYQMFKELNPA